MVELLQHSFFVTMEREPHIYYVFRRIIATEQRAKHNVHNTTMSTLHAETILLSMPFS